MERTFTRKWGYGLYLTLTAAAIVILAAMLFVLRESKQTMATIGPLADAAMEVTIEANLAHLYMEEYVTHGYEQSLEKAWQHLDIADNYARGIMEGDTVGLKIYRSVVDGSFGDVFGDLQLRLAEFRNTAEERIRRLSDTTYPGHVHHQHDSAFVAIVTQASTIEEQLRKIIAERTVYISQVQTVLIFGSLLFFTVVGLIIRRQVKQLALSEAGINHLNLVLKAVRNVTQLMTREKDPQRLIQRSCELLVETRGFHNAWIVVVSKDGKPELLAEAGLGNEFSVVKGLIEKGEFVPCCRQLDVHDGVLPVKDPPQDCPECPLAQLYTGRAGMAAKLEHHNRNYGYMVVSAPRQNAFGPEEQRLLCELAEDIALSLHHTAVEKERLQAMQALRRSEEQYRTLAANIPTSDIYLFDKDLRYVVADGTELRKNGLTGDFYEGRSLYETWDDALIGIFEPLYKRAINGQSGSTEFKCCGKYYSLSVVPVFNERNEPTGGLALSQNITERKLAEEERRNSEEKYRVLFESTDHLVSVFDKNGTCLLMNHAAARQFGGKPEDFIGSTFSHLHAEAGAAYTGRIRTVMESGEIQRYEDLVQFPQGDRILLTTVHPVRNSSGEMYAVQVISSDITESKMAEQEIRNSQSLLQSVFDAIPGLINVIDKNLNVVWSNWHDHDYISEQERQSKPKCHRVFLHKQHPCEKCHVLEIFETGKPITAEVHNSVDGGYKEVRSFPVRDVTGEVKYVVEYAEDITQRKRHEKVQQALVNIAEASCSAPGVREFIALVHKELGTIIDAANFYIALWDPETEYYSFPYSVDQYDGTDFTPEQLKKSLTDYVRRTGRPLLADEATHRRLLQAGEADIVGQPSKLWMGVPLKTANGVIGVVVVQNYTDNHAYSSADLDLLSFVTGHITSALERKIALETIASYNRQLVQANRELELKQAELEEFIYTVSHDLKAPVVSISGFAGLIKEKLTGLVDEGTAKYLERIHVNSAVMDSLIGDLLELSRIGRVEEKMTTINFDAVTDEILDSFSVAARGKNIRLVKSNHLPNVNGWQKRIRQMLSNLVDNAIKYMPRKKDATVEIGCRPSNNSSMGCFYVRDNGVGVPPEFHERIFAMFQRAQTPGPEIQGSGIGLTIVKRIVEKHGGKVWVESGIGRGATFCFTLPLDGTLPERDQNTQITQHKSIEL
ncbi:MAG: PAS domain-containing protein [Candidatus Zixiibacteriota bacterium]